MSQHNHDAEGIRYDDSVASHEELSDITEADATRYGLTVQQLREQVQLSNEILEELLADEALDAGWFQNESGEI